MSPLYGHAATVLSAARDARAKQEIDAVKAHITERALYLLTISSEPYDAWHFIYEVADLVVRQAQRDGRL
jgi:hypothetical protein